jgi:UDP-glucose 4-epimerase
VPIIIQTAVGLRASTDVLETIGIPEMVLAFDYIYVRSIADAHLLALEKLFEINYSIKFDIINLGRGEGVSVFESINSFKKISDIKVNYKILPRR